MSARPENWEREYPWTPKPGKTVVQSFAAIRSGLLPCLVLDDKGHPRYTIVDVFTKSGQKQYDAEAKRAVQEPTKKGK